MLSLKFMAFLLLPALASAHPALLPRPRQIQYGAGKLAVRGLSIGFASHPTAEDRFAAGALAAALSRIARSNIAVAAGQPAGPSILLARTGAVDAMPGPDDRAGPDSREAYEIRIDARGAEVRARSSAGLYYGVETLRQMVEQDSSGPFLPEAAIHDWPALAYRGFMMDTSHGPLPSESEVERQIDFLARWKANQYYLYSEASIELRGYSLVDPDGRYTQEQIRRIIRYARQRHVDVVPCVELYGHLHDLFRLERYSDLSALPYSGEIDPRNPRVQELLADWIRQLAALFPSPWFHAGLDEPWEIEITAKASGLDAGRVFIGQLQKTIALIQQAGKRPMFWADVNSGARIFAKYPELFSQLPKSVIAVPWRYDPLPDFSAFVAPFAREHVAQVVAPGVWCWNEIAPDFYRSFANIDGFVADGRKYGAMGMVNTGWTDAGQVLYRTARPGMAYGAVAGWQDKPVDRGQFFADYAAQMYPPEAASDAAAGLASLASAQQQFEQALGLDSIYRFWEDPLLPARAEHAQAQREALRKVRLLAEDAQERFARAAATARDTETLPSLVLVSRMLDYAGMKYVYAGDLAAAARKLGTHPARADVSQNLYRPYAVVDHGRLSDLMDAIASLRESYRSAWRAEYTDYRLGTVLGRWDAEYQYWRGLQSRLQDLIRGFKDGDTLPPLESPR